MVVIFFSWHNTYSRRGKAKNTLFKLPFTMVWAKALNSSIQKERLQSLEQEVRREAGCTESMLMRVVRAAAAGSSCRRGRGRFPAVARAVTDVTEEAAGAAPRDDALCRAAGKWGFRIIPLGLEAGFSGHLNSESTHFTFYKCRSASIRQISVAYHCPPWMVQTLCTHIAKSQR